MRLRTIDDPATTPPVKPASGQCFFVLRAGAGRVLAPFAAAGRMAFTNYLTQSIVMTSIFYGGRGALMGQVDRPALFAIVGAEYIARALPRGTQEYAKFIRPSEMARAAADATAGASSAASASVSVVGRL